MTGDTTGIVDACPWCGTKIAGLHLRRNAHTFRSTTYQVFCEACGAHGPDAETPEAAWEAWNSYQEKTVEGVE